MTTQSGAIFDLSSMTNSVSCQDRYRRPIVLFYLEGKKAEEVATALGLPKGTVLSQLSRAANGCVFASRAAIWRFSVGVFASLLERTASSGAAVPDRLLELGMQTLPSGGAGVSAQAQLLARQALKDMLAPRLWTIGSVASAALLAAWVGFQSYRAVRVPPVRLRRAGCSGRSEIRSGRTSGRLASGRRRTERSGFAGRPVPGYQPENTRRHHRPRGRTSPRAASAFPAPSEQKPKAMDMESEGYHGDSYHAIYALEGDTLTICLPDDATRPTKFASSPGSNVLLYTSKRIRPGGP